ncbi:MAG TPA: MATE family efflux transporter [Hanamia sp.]|nr:MATE family efflux transporter [Hanamia sp.]
MKEKILAPYTFILSLLNKGHDRSIKAKKNIIASVFIRGISIAISLLLVPLTINYVNVSQYGIWLTLSSIVGWFSFFDIGFTKGLRNKFAEAKATGDHELAQVYVSTTYAILAIIFCLIWLIFLLVNHFLNWAHILNVSESMRPEISVVAVIVFTYFCLQFVLRIITTIITADQQPAKASLIDVLGQVLSLIFVLILVKTTQGSLINLGWALCASPILVLLAANIFFFRGTYKNYKPLISKVKFSQIKGLFNIGIIFFIIQIAGIVQYQTANIIIAQNFGTSDVTSYNIVYKYFGTLSMAFIIFLTPFWSASTEAYMKNDIQWIKNAIKKYIRLNLLLVGAGVLMLVFSNQIYSLWLGKGKVKIDFSLSFWGFLFFSMQMYESKYIYFLNGISALRIQFWACAISPFLYIASALILIKYYHFGVYALFVASIIANFNGIVLAPIQYYQIIYRNKKGVWLK